MKELFAAAAKAGAAAGGEATNKPKLVQIGMQLASMKDVIRIYTDNMIDAHGEYVYRIVFRSFKGYEFEEYYTWRGDEAEDHRDQEFGELNTRLEQAGYQIV